jgi:hypothetical protein
MPVTKELPDHATHEEIEAFVHEIVVERHGEPTAKSNGKAPKADKTKQPDPTPAPTGDDFDINELPDDELNAAGKKESAAAKDDDGEDSAEEEEAGQDWLDDDLRAEVSAMGIEGELLSEFSSREELDKALKLLDLAAMKAGRAAVEPRGDEEPADKGKTGRKHRADGTFAPADEEKQADPKPGDFKLDLDPEEYGEGLVTQVKALHDHFASKLNAAEERAARLEQAWQSQQTLVFEERFDSVVESLGHSDLFGETGKETPAQMANRQKLMGEYLPYEIGLRAQGRNPVLGRSLVDRVCRMAFADHLSKKERKALTKKISKQSALKGGDAGGKGPETPESRKERFRRMYKEMGG